MKHVKCKGCGQAVRKRHFRTTTCRFCGRKRRPFKELAITLCALLGSATLVGAVTLATFSWQAARDLGFIESVKKPDVHFATDEDFDTIAGDYPDAAQYLAPFDDRIDGSKPYALANNCATTAVITNNYDKEMHISKMRIEAAEVAPDNEPRIKASLLPDDRGIRIRLINEGWADAENLHIRAESKSGSLKERFGTPTIDTLVPVVGKASDTEVRFLRNSDLMKHGDEEFELTFAASDDNHGDVYIEVENPSFYVEGGKLNAAYGKGGPSHNVYGVKIDTSSGNFSYEGAVSENVKPDENICIPVCFFPDQSCRMKMRLSFEVVKGDVVETVSTETAELHILVPSIYNDRAGVDMTDQDAVATAMRQFDVVDRRETAMSYPLSEAVVF